MPRRVVLTAVLCALPALLVGISGTQHPMHLTYATSHTWYEVHLPGVVLVPLIGVALGRLVHGRADATAWLIRLTAFGFATFYTSLDVISGIAAAYETHQLGPGVPRPESIHLQFHIGTQLGRVGSISLMCCAVLVALDALVDVQVYGVAGLLLVPGSYLVHTHHIFPWLGVIGVWLLGLGCAGLIVGRHLATRRENQSARDATNRAAAAS